MKYLHSLIVILLSVNLNAQLLYNWEENRSPITTTIEEEENEALIYLKYHKQFNYIYEGTDGDLFMYETEHKIIKANNDNAIARVNRIYIPLRNSELVTLKARSITKDGKVVLFDESELKELADEESGTEYRIFAIEGAEVGSEIEYFYTVRGNASYFGREYFQFSEPVLDASFVLTCPSNLEFDFKSYNGLPQSTFDNAEQTNIYTISAENIAPLKKEEFSSYDNSRQRLEFKLGYNKVTGRKLFRWEDAAQLLYQRAFVISKNDQKLIDELIEGALSDKEGELISKIKTIEHYIKTNFYLNENASAEASEISFMIDNRIGDKLGLSKLLLHSIKQIGANPQLVLTSDRSKVAFDGSFETYNFLQEYIVYVPEDDAFIAPYSPEFRYGMVPFNLSATDGLFIREEVIDEMPYPKFDIKEIPALSADENLDKMEVSVSFNEDLSANNIMLKRSFNGYQAAFIKAVYPLIEEVRRQELLKNLVKFLATDADIKTLQMDQTEFDYTTWSEPLIVDSEFQSASYIENAGDIILLKVGEMIGPQTELYQERARMTRVQNDFNRTYDRSIEIEIPKNYIIENLEDLNFDISVTEGDDTIYYFKSYYKLEGQLLKVQVDEGYEKIYYPKENFEEFRKVINAAADWNKIVLVMSNE